MGIFLLTDVCVYIYIYIYIYKKKKKIYFSNKFST